MLSLSVIKIGGNLIDSTTELDHFLGEFAKLSGPKILVHGGGQIATKIGERLGIVSQYRDEIGRAHV